MESQMQVKLLEIRDRATFIPVFAMLMEPGSAEQGYLLRRAGYGPESNLIMMGNLSGGNAHYDPYERFDSPKTLKTAHQYIIDNWNHLADGDVIDIEFILGESTFKKTSERFED